MQTRDASEVDIPAITAIYNEVVLTSTAIYNDQLATEDDRLHWWRSRVEQGCPVLVAEADNRTIQGFATYGDFRAWPGYRFTVEGTIHIDAESRGRGIGAQLLTELVKRAALAGKHTMIAAVDSENHASPRFLKRFGFEQRGYLPEVGYKFGRFLDLVLLQYAIVPL